MYNLWRKETWVFSTRGLDGTLTIGVCFVFLAYILHPAIECAYQRVRAYRAWRAIESHKSVDVTNYPIVEEVLWGRGKWDAARIITVLLAAFSLASWGLELSMDLAYYKGDADLLNRPPPVRIRNATGTKYWQVKTLDDLGHEHWRELPNIFEGGAKSRYYMEANTKYEGFVNGAVSVAYWYTEAARTPTQFYYLDGAAATVKGLECTAAKHPDPIDVYLGDTTKWGTVLECENGPSLTDDLLLLHDDKIVTPPTIIMTSSEGEVFLIVEESSSYPSFLYSIWTVGSQNSTPTELQHVFHIAANMRLAEAVVTGIVHGEISGGACFGMLRKFSETREVCKSVVFRASPFGEHPTGDSVQIQELEHVEVGLEISLNALVCFVCIMVLTSISITWLCCLSSSIGMDVYDRDALIRAVSMAGASDDGALPSAMRIFVRKEESGDIKVVINGTRGVQSGCARILRNRGNVANDATPGLISTAVAPCSDGFADSVVPIASRAVVLEGVRVRPIRTSSAPDRIFRCPTSVSLLASPIPSKTASVPVTPAKNHFREKSIAQIGREYKGGGGASFLFDTMYCSGDSDDGGTEVTQVSYDKAVEGDGKNGVYNSAFAGRRGVSATSDGVRSCDIEMPRQLGHGDGNETSQCFPGRTTIGVSEESMPLPPSLLRRDFTLGPPPPGPLPRRWDKGTLEGTDCSEDVC